jgi:RNA polymerase sigma factor (sigma-70 family)
MIASVPLPNDSRKNRNALAETPLSATGLAAVPAQSPPDIAQDIDWVDLVSRVQKNEAESLEQLYALISRGIRVLIVRQVGRQDLEDRVHDTFLTVVQAVQRGDLREPDRLLAFARTIVRRKIAQYIEKHSAARREVLSGETGDWLPAAGETPEEAAIRQQTMEILENVLRGMSRRDREILTRFYLHDQTPATICREMELTDTQFRLLKSRAKARFADEGRKRTAKNRIQNFFLRKNETS